MKRTKGNVARCQAKMTEINDQLDEFDESRSLTQLRSKFAELSNIVDSMVPKGLYEKLEPPAHNVKVIGQMLVGTAVVCVVLLKATINMFNHLQFMNVDDTLTTVSGGLAVAATLELAYTFFTSGPDEAVEPLILGLAAAVLLAITSLKTPTWAAAGLIAALVFALVLLFVVRDFFIVDPNERRISRQK